MANQHVSSVSATQVGSYFVQQYYQVFQQQRDYVHRFYNESSSMVRVDGEISHSASDMVKIHELIMSLDFTGIEIKTINSLESWSGGVLVVVSGSVKSADFVAGRKFVQTFFLAPQEKGYFVLNDMFHFSDEDLAHQPVAQHNVDYQPTISNHLPDQPVSDYGLEEEARNYVNSINIEGNDPIREYSYQEHHHQEEWDPVLEQEFESEQPDSEAEAEALRLEEETTAFLRSIVIAQKETEPSKEEPVVEPEKLTYASILRAKGKPPSTFTSPPAFTQRAQPAADWNHVSQSSLQQSDATRPSSREHAVVEALPQEEGASKSVYVRNLPSTVTTLDILEEFKRFGKIESDGVFLRNREDSGVCYAFVEFEDVQSVGNAVKASPIQLDGRNVYIEERRPNAGASRGGRRGGRGSGGRGGRFPGGRGSHQNGGDHNRVRYNSFRGV